MDYIAQGVLQAFVLLGTGHEETWSAVYTTVEMSTLSIVVCLALGVPLGFLLGYAEFPGKRGVRTVVDTLLAHGVDLREILQPLGSGADGGERGLGHS